MLNKLAFLFFLLLITACSTQPQEEKQKDETKDYYVNVYCAYYGTCYSFTIDGYKDDNFHASVDGVNFNIYSSGVYFCYITNSFTAGRVFTIKLSNKGWGEITFPYLVTEQLDLYNDTVFFPALSSWGPNISDSLPGNDSLTVQMPGSLYCNHHWCMIEQNSSAHASYVYQEEYSSSADSNNIYFTNLVNSSTWEEVRSQIVASNSGQIISTMEWITNFLWLPNVHVKAYFIAGQGIKYFNP